MEIKFALIYQKNQSNRMKIENSGNKMSTYVWCITSACHKFVTFSISNNTDMVPLNAIFPRKDPIDFLWLKKKIFLQLLSVCLLFQVIKKKRIGCLLVTWGTVRMDPQLQQQQLLLTLTTAWPTTARHHQLSHRQLPQLEPMAAKRMWMTATLSHYHINSVNS